MYTAGFSHDIILPFLSERRGIASWVPLPDPENDSSVPMPAATLLRDGGFSRSSHPRKQSGSQYGTEHPPLT